MPPLRTALRALPLGAALALAAVAPAAAGTLSVDYSQGVVSYKAAAGEVNNFSAYYLASGEYRLQDPGVASVPLTEFGGSNCVLGEPWKYRCKATGLHALQATLGDGADVFDDRTATLDTTVWTGAGSKTITTGSGADTINARNGSVDQISCGDGADTAIVDADDVVDASCEDVDPPGSGEETDGTGATATTDPTAAPSTGSADPGATSTPTPTDVFHSPVGLTIAASKVPVAAGRALVALSCAADADGGCRGDITLLAPAGKRTQAGHGRVIAARGHYLAQQRARGRKIGRCRFRIAAGQSARIPVLLRGHYRFVSRRRHRHAVLRITERDAAGKVLDVQTRSVVLTPAKKRGQR